MQKTLSHHEKQRLKKIALTERKRALVLERFCSENGRSDKERSSLRDIGKLFGYSHTHIRSLRNRFLKAKHYHRFGVPYTKYTKIEGYTKILAPKRPGPAKGQYTPKRDEIRDAVIETKQAYMKLGAAKIGKISGVNASHPTVHAVLREAGFENVTMRLGKVYKSFEMPHVNDMWQIDYVELGTDRTTGRKVEFLSVIDDKSRRMLSHTVDVYATTDNVLRILEECIEEYGTPRMILSDHGTQWAASNGGDTRFDEWCESKGIRHVMGGVRKPTTQGKVERWHGSIRREANLPGEATLEEYDALMSRYIEFYNETRPHWALDLKTPSSVFCEDR
jgi:transposase InsO family protein